MSTLSITQPKSHVAILAAPTALVITVVHNPEDSRVRQRQIAALIAAGWQITYAAPFGAYGLDLPSEAVAAGGGTLRCIDLPRAQGRDRMPAWRAARSVLRSLAGDHDLVVVHDPELVLAAAGMGLTNLVWDVHEDPAAALQVKSWMPALLRRPGAAMWRRVEQVIERRHRLLLAEYAYQERFRHQHPVLANAVAVAANITPAGDDRVSYLGSVTMSRGCDTMIEVARDLRSRTDGAVRVEIIGEAADEGSRKALQSAEAAGDVTWRGFLRSDVALARVSGSLAGLCLLRDLPNFRHSLPTKLVEYGALGVPVITTPLPLARKLVDDDKVGVVVPWQDPHAVVDAILALRNDRALRLEVGANGHRAALRDHDWNRLSARFVDLMGSFADQTRAARSAVRRTTSAVVSLDPAPDALAIPART
jgi:glycosyltransferase involved in cell wall biosynthesis